MRSVRGERGPSLRGAGATGAVPWGRRFLFFLATADNYIGCGSRRPPSEGQPRSRGILPTMRSVSKAGVGLIAVGSAALVAASAAAVILEASGRDVGVFPLVVAGLVIALGVLMAAATAAHAFIRRRWGWAVALLLVWPVAVPLYLRTIYRAELGTSPSREAEV